MHVYIYLCALHMQTPLLQTQTTYCCCFLLHAYIHINSKKEPTLSDYEINNSYIIQIYIECLGVGT